MTSRGGKIASLAALVAAAVIHGCAPQRSYRAPAPSVGGAPPPGRSPQTASVPPPPTPAPEISRKPVPDGGKILEQDIGSKLPTQRPPVQQGRESTSRPGTENRGLPESSVVQPSPSPLPDDSSLIAKITPSVTPQRAASLRLTEEGRKFLEAGEAAKALARLERTIVIDSTNPYGYFYIAKAHHVMGRHRESLNFLDIAESRLSGEPFWLAEVHALRGENYRALGQLRRAELSYLQSLRLNSGNRTAAEALSRMQVDAPPPGQ